MYSKYFNLAELPFRITPETEELIEDNASELFDSIDDFDDDVQIAILENL